MNYFNGITDLEQAKLHYRKLAKQLHPDKGGTAVEFQKMQDEYKTILQQLEQKHKVVTHPLKSASAEKELISELGKLAKVLIKKQVPQYYLRQKIQTTESKLKKGFINGLVRLLDKL